MIFLLYFVMVFLEMFISSFSFLNGIDFAFIFVFLVSFYYSPFVSLIFAFFSGIYVDFYYSFPLGLHSMVYVLLSYVMNLIKSNVDFDFVFSRFFNFILFNIITRIMVFVGSYLTGWKISIGWGQFLYPFLSFIFFEILRVLMIGNIINCKNYGNR